MIVSPGESSSASALTVNSVGAPDGTITQTARGALSCATSAASESTPVAPTSRTRVTASRLRSQATTAWLPWVSRVTMFMPILPRPTNPSCMRCSLLRVNRLRGRTSRFAVVSYMVQASICNADASSAGSGTGRWMWMARRPLASSELKSPSACANSRVPNE